MKIGIITQPLETNYGGLLQNYALQEALRRHGHDVLTLDQPYLIPSKRKVLINSIKSIVKNILGKKTRKPIYITQQEIETIAVHTQKFVNKYIKHTERLSSKKDFIKAVTKNNIEALVVGSDQVWRPLYNPRLTKSFFDFVKDQDIIRLAYAASFGVDNWEYSTKETRICSRLAKLFKAISVREMSGIKLCKKHLGVEATFVLDPTMLLDKEDYIKIVEESGITSSKGNMFTYILDNTDEKQKFIDKIAKKLNLTPFSVMPRKNKLHIKKDIEACVCPPVEQWIRAFMDAKFVVCDSFHGAVFSIIFNKPFVIIGNEERGMSRFNSLVEMYSLEERLLNTTSDISIVDKAIDWESVNNKRKEMRELSIKFLKENLL